MPNQLNLAPLPIGTAEPMPAPIVGRIAFIDGCFCRIRDVRVNPEGVLDVDVQWLDRPWE